MRKELTATTTMKEKITIDIAGQSQTHIAFTDHGYATLCGLDGDDSGISMQTVDTPKGAKVGCAQCKSIWEEARNWRDSDFAH